MLDSNAVGPIARSAAEKCSKNCHYGPFKGSATEADILVEIATQPW